MKVKEGAGVLGKLTGANRFFARLIAQGQGSSGYHTEEALKETGASAFPMGTRIHFDHDHDVYSQLPEGSVKDLVGVVATDPVYTTGEDGIPGLYATVEFDEQHSGFIEKFKNFLGLSISVDHAIVQGTTDDGYDRIIGYMPSPLNRVDVVTAAGAGGKIISAAESYKNHDRIVNDESNNGKEHGMKPEDIEAIATAVSESITPLFTSLKEALTPAPPVEDEDDNGSEDNTVEVAEALVEAELPKAARDRVYAAVKEGKAVSEAIATEQEYIKEISESVSTESVGRITESATKLNKPSTLGVTGWGV